MKHPCRNDSFSRCTKIDVFFSAASCKKDITFGADRKLFGTSYFVTALILYRCSRKIVQLKIQNFHPKNIFIFFLDQAEEEEQSESDEDVENDEAEEEDENDEVENDKAEQKGKYRLDDCKS